MYVKGSMIHKFLFLIDNKVCFKKHTYDIYIYDIFDTTHRFSCVSTIFRRNTILYSMIFKTCNLKNNLTITET